MVGFQATWHDRVDSPVEDIIKNIRPSDRRPGMLQLGGPISFDPAVRLS